MNLFLVLCFETTLSKTPKTKRNVIRIKYLEYVRNNINHEDNEKQAYYHCAYGI